MAGLFRVYARRPFLFTTPTPVSSSICHISDHWHSRLLRASRERPCGRYNPKQRDEVAAPHGDLPQGKDHELSITGQPVHRVKLTARTPNRLFHLVFDSHDGAWDVEIF